MSFEYDASDYHYLVRGVLAMPPDKLFAQFVSAINTTSFLKIVEGNESKRILKITSTREQDPEGSIEIKINSYEAGSSYLIRVNDEVYIKELREEKRSLAPSDKNTFVNAILSPIEEAQRQEVKHDKFGLFKP